MRVRFPPRSIFGSLSLPGCSLTTWVSRFRRHSSAGKSNRSSTGRSWVQLPLAARFVDLAQPVERRPEEPRVPGSNPGVHSFGMPKGECRMPNEDACDRFHSAFGTTEAVVTQWQSASLPNWERGFDSHPPHSSFDIRQLAFGISHAVVAQSAERSPRKRQVAGSRPARGLSFGRIGCVAQRQSRGLISLRLLVRVQPFTQWGNAEWRMPSAE